jgi:hypothetical protein
VTTEAVETATPVMVAMVVTTSFLSRRTLSLFCLPRRRLEGFFFPPRSTKSCRTGCFVFLGVYDSLPFNAIFLVAFQLDLKMTLRGTARE